jgi:hypothetical protein
MKVITRAIVSAVLSIILVSCSGENVSPDPSSKKDIVPQGIEIIWPDTPNPPWHMPHYSATKAFQYWHTTIQDHFELKPIKNQKIFSPKINSVFTNKNLAGRAHKTVFDEHISVLFSTIFHNWTHSLPRFIGVPTLS